MLSGSLGLLAFSASILAGVWADNDLTTILTRAWWVLILFLVFGAIVGWIAQTVINEHLRQSTPDTTDQQQDETSMGRDKGLSGTHKAV
jgi:thiosulfate reductase cytochrome b subunit